MQNAESFEKVIKIIKIFIYGNDLSYFFENRFKKWLLYFLFPSLSKSLIKLTSDMRTLTKLLNGLSMEDNHKTN